MAKNSIDAYGALGKTNVLLFDPDDLVLVTDPNHALFDERVNLPLVENMVLNIMAIGVHTPISITKDPETGQTLVVAGRQRVKHTREANRRMVARGLEKVLVPGIVKRGDLDALMISENEQRQADTPLGRAQKMARAQSRGRDEAWLATMFGCSVQTVKRTLALLDAPVAVREAVEAGKVTLTAAHQLAKLAPEDQRAKVAELVAAADTTTGRARSQAQRDVVDGGKPRMRTRTEIKAAIAAATHPVTSMALAWVLGDRAEVA